MPNNVDIITDPDKLIEIRRRIYNTVTSKRNNTQRQKKMALKLLHVFKQLLNEFNNYQFERKEKNLKSKNDIGQYPVTSP